MKRIRKQIADTPKEPSTPYPIASWLRRVLISWLFATTFEYILLPSGIRDLSGLDGLKEMSLLRVILITGALYVILWLVAKWSRRELTERLMLLGSFAVLTIFTLISSYTLAFLITMLLLLAALGLYAWRGWQKADEDLLTSEKVKEKPIFLCLTIGLALVFFVFVSVWTLSRVYSFSTPTYDFGIFSQMFHHMKTTGAPTTTLERDGMLSHFKVHVSPIWYLLLPFYALFPTPATLQVLQAAIITSASIPLWLLGKRHGLSPFQRMLLCVMLLLFPAFSGGTSFDIHENAFLTPLILWTFYGIDRHSLWLTALAAALTLTVKEDAAVYVAVIAVYLIVKSLVRFDRQKLRTLITGGVMLLVSLVYFTLVTAYLAESGDGVMTYRYSNFIYDGSSSLFAVVKAVLLCPAKMIYECVDTEKLTFIAQTLLPLLGLPLITRKYERYVLLIPYVLLNLMSDYVYQHDIMFQYTFGSNAFLFYLALINLADLKKTWELKKIWKPKEEGLPREPWKKLSLRTPILGAAVILSAVMFSTIILPTGLYYPRIYNEYKDYYTEIRETLALVPDDASVTATTFLTTELSDREICYDFSYASRLHLLSSDYIVLDVSYKSTYNKYGGYDKLVTLLENSDYTVFAEMEGKIVIYQKQALDTPA